MTGNVYKIHVRYGAGHCSLDRTSTSISGHWILADSEEDALRIANKYKAGNPMGSDKGVIERKLCDCSHCSPEPYELFVPHSGLPLDPKKHYRGGKLWKVVDNELIGFSTPRYKDIGTPSNKETK